MLGLRSFATEVVSSDGVPRFRVLVSDLDIFDDHVILQQPDGSFFK